MDDPQFSLYHAVNTTTTAGVKRYPLLENYPALLRHDFFPPEEEWPELADLRDEHVRYLDACEAALARAAQTNSAFAAEDREREEEMRAAIRENREEEPQDPTPPEVRQEQQQDNIARIQAALDALVDFLGSSGGVPDWALVEAPGGDAPELVAAKEAALKAGQGGGALGEMRERAPALYAGLEAEGSVADEKRQEAARLLAEAEQVVARLQRKRAWLDRESGRSALPHYPFADMPVPAAPEALDLVAVLAGGSDTTVAHV